MSVSKSLREIRYCSYAGYIALSLPARHCRSSVSAASSCHPGQYTLAQCVPNGPGCAMACGRGMVFFLAGAQFSKPCTEQSQAPTARLNSARLVAPAGSSCAVATLPRHIRDDVVCCLDSAISCAFSWAPQYSCQSGGQSVTIAYQTLP